MALKIIEQQSSLFDHMMSCVNYLLADHYQYIGHISLLISSVGFSWS